MTVAAVRATESVASIPSDAQESIYSARIRCSVRHGDMTLVPLTELRALVAEIDRLRAASPSPWRGMESVLEEAARACEGAQLPDHFRWGRDAMEQFNFGKKRCAEAVRALKPLPSPPSEGKTK